MDSPEELLRRVAAGDEPTVLSPDGPQRSALDRATRALVQLSALLATDAATTSLRWAVDTAAAIGLDDAAMIQVLVATASATGAAQTVANAPRLALALGIDLEVEGWDGS